MKKAITSFLLLFASLGSYASEESVGEINSCFDTFKKCAMEINGKAVINHIDRQSISYCDELIEDSLYLSTERFNRLPMVKKYLIMRLCTTVPFGILLEMHGREFIIYSVSYEWFCDDLTESITIGDIRINRDTAYAEIYRNGQKTGYRYKFVKEGGAWKFSFLSHLSFINATLKSDCLKSGKSEDEYLKSILQPFVNSSLDDFKFEPILTK